MSGLYSDEEKVEAVRQAFELGDWVTGKVNSTRGWTKTSQTKLRRELTRVLRVVLGRAPTAVEVDRAGAEEDCS